MTTETENAMKLSADTEITTLPIHLTASASSAKPFLASLDNPQDLAVITDYVLVAGWALFSADGVTDGIGDITVSVGSIPGRVNRYNRTDVQSGVPGYPDYSRCGFETTVDTRTLLPGTYPAIVSIYDKQGMLIHRYNKRKKTGA